MNKKKFLLLITGIVLIAGVSFTAWFVSEIKIYGEIKINIVSNNVVSSESVFIKAHTPTGREVVTHFEDNKASLIGFYNDAAILMSCHVKIEKILIEHDEMAQSYNVTNQCVGGQKIFDIIPEEVGRSNFFRKFQALFNWLLSLRAIQEFFIAVIFLFLVVSAWLLCRKNKKTKENRQNNEKRKLVNRIIVVLSGLAFWLLIVAVVLEIGLRVFGSLYSSKHAGVSAEERDSTFTVLCIGDSFTYGIGAHRNKSYPKQLEGLISSREGIPVRVINAGICAGNTTQMLGNIQELLNQNHPDVVVMLFGMANSWNYYGFSKTNSFLYKIKTYKLIIRLIQNFHYKRHGLELQERVNSYTNRQLAEAWHSIIKNERVAIRYNMGRYYLAAREWKSALGEFSSSSEQQPVNDSVRDALWTCLDKLDAFYYFKSAQIKEIQNTVVPETMYLLDSLILMHKQSIDLKIIRYRYSLVKGDTSSAQKEIFKCCKKYDNQDVFYYDLLRTVRPEHRIAFFNQNSDLYKKRAGFWAALGLASLMENKVKEAKQNFDCALRINPEDPLSQAGDDIYTVLFSIKNNFKPQLKTKSKLLRLLFYEIAERVYGLANPWPATVLTYKERMFFNMVMSGVCKNHTNKDSLFASYASSAIFQYWAVKEKFHNDFFLIHRNKRTMNLNDREVFDWIERDINTITDICLKQVYKVVCMNYPIIPPPNSEEISYWAAGVGEIWKHIAQKKSIPFINQDSLFENYGINKSSLFEPAFTGSEHCNEKGYWLMANNIYICFKNNDYINKKK